MKLKESDVGKRFRTRNGKIVTGERWDHDDEELPFDTVESGWYHADGTHCLFSPELDIVARYDERSRKRAKSKKREKTPMPKKTPTKYFVGQLDKVKRGSVFQVFRQRRSMLGNIVNEMWTRSGWKKMKVGFRMRGMLLNSRDDARQKPRPPAS